MMEGLRTSLAHVTGTARLSVEGEVDVMTVEVFRAALREAIEAAETTVAVNLDRVDYFGSEGLGALIRARKAAVERGLELHVSSCTPSIHRVMVVSGVAELFGLPAMDSGGS